MHKNLLLGSMLILLSAKAIAQGGVSLLSNGSIGISYTLEPERKFKNANGGYKYNAVGLNAKIPLFGNRGNGSGHFYETSLRPMYRLLLQLLDLLIIPAIF